MIYILIILLFFGLITGVCLNYFYPSIGVTKVSIISFAVIVVIGGILYFIIFKAAHELPESARIIDKSEVTKNIDD